MSRPTCPVCWDRGRGCTGQMWQTSGPRAPTVSMTMGTHTSPTQTGGTSDQQVVLSFINQMNRCLSTTASWLCSFYVLCYAPMYTIHVLNPWLCSTGGVSRCVAMNSGSRAGLWYDIMCNMTSGAVCEKLRLGYTSPATPPPTTPGLPCPANWIEVNNYCYQVGKFEPSPVCQ